MTPLDHPGNLEKYEYVERSLHDLQSDVIDSRLERLLGGIRLMIKEIAGASRKWEAVCKDGIINVMILPSLRGEVVRYARHPGIDSEDLVFDTQNRAIFTREIEGKLYKITITKEHDVGRMSLEETTTEIDESAPTVDSKDTIKKDLLQRSGELPKDYIILFDGISMIVKNEKGTLIAEVNLRGVDLSIPGKTHRVQFYGNNEHPGNFDLYVTNRNGPLLFRITQHTQEDRSNEFNLLDGLSEQDTKDNQQNEQDKKDIVQNEKEASQKEEDLTQGEEKESQSNKEKISTEEKTQELTEEKTQELTEEQKEEQALEETDKETKPAKPLEDQWPNNKEEQNQKQAEEEFDELQTKPEEQTKEQQKSSDQEKKSEQQEGKEKTTDEQKSERQKVAETQLLTKESQEANGNKLPGEKVVKLAYGVRIHYGEWGPEFGEYDMTIRTLDGKVIDEYYVDYYRHLTDQRFFYIRKKEPTSVPIPFSKREKELPNLPDINRDDEMFAIDIKVQELMEGGTRTYIDREGDPWKIRAVLDDKKVLRVFADAPLEAKRKEEEYEKKQDALKPKFDFPDGIFFPEFDIVAKTKEQLEKIKERMRELISDTYEEEDGHVPGKDTEPVPPEKTVSIEDNKITIKGVARDIYALPPYSEEEVSDIKAVWIPNKGFKLRLVTKYFDGRRDKDLVVIDLSNKVTRGKILEKDGRKVKIDVNSKGILIISAAPPASITDEVLKPEEKIETKNIGFLWPTKEGEVTSGYCERPDPNNPEVCKRHRGVDINVDAGTPIMAPFDGVVVFSGTATGYGQTVLLEHHVGNNKYRTLYAHLTPSSVTNLQPGDKVKRGEEFAKSGGKRGSPGSGNSTGAHLHFEVRTYNPNYKEGKWKFREPVDPLNFYASQNIHTDSVSESVTQPSTSAPETKPNTHEQNDVPDFVAKVIPIPDSEPPIKLGVEDKKIKSLLNTIKNFSDTRYADMPEDVFMEAGYEEGKFVILDGRGNILLDLDSFENQFRPFTYNDRARLRESRVVERKIKGDTYKIKIIIRSFGTMSIRMDKK